MYYIIFYFRMVGMLLAAPFWGMIADKWHCHKSIIVIAFIGLFVTVGSQPLLSMKYGDPAVNICPIPKIEVSVDTANYNQNCSSFINTNNNKENCSLPEDTIGSNIQGDLRRISLFNNGTTYLDHGKKDERKKYGALFFVMFFMQIATLFFESASTIFIDTATLRHSQLSKTRKIEYGKQRVWGAFGAMSGITLTNLVIEYFPSVNITCYTGLYITYGVFTFLVTVSMLFLYKGLSFETTEKDEEKAEVTVKMKHNFKKILLKTLLRFDMLFFYFTTLIAGMVYATYTSFFYLHLTYLRAPPVVFSLSIVVAAAGAMFGFFFSNKIMKLVGGTWKTIILTFLAFATRNAAIALIVNPWLILLAQTIHPFTFVLYMAVGLRHLKEVSPLPVITTMVSLFISTFMGLGAIVGSSLSGVVFNSYGGRATFLSASALSFIWALIVVLYTVYVLKNSRKDKSKI